MKFIFHWKAQLLILAKSLFSSFADVFLSYVMENKDVSSANSLALEERPVVRSLMQIKNNKGSNMDPWGTSAVTSTAGNLLIQNNLCFLSFKKSTKNTSRFSLISFCFNLKIIPSSQTLSNAFDISRNTPLISYPSSNDL